MGKHSFANILLSVSWRKKMKQQFTLILLFIFSTIFAENLDIAAIDLLSHNKNISNDSLFTIFENWQNYSQPTKTDTFLLEYNQINDTLAAPYVVYIPQNYDSTQKTKLIFCLHGGVSRKDFVSESIEYAKQNSFTSYAKENNWIVVYPMGNIDVAWWSLAGINNLKTQIRKIKSEYNIDDTSVYLAGFSDGASGSYHLALNVPDDFASFYPFNGMLSVGSAVTQIPIYLPNFRNRSIYAINTDKDGLYPASKMRNIIEIALDAGADLFYKEYWGFGHTFDYADKELPIVFDNIKKSSRNIFQPKIYWETASLEFGKCDWLEITKLDTIELAKDWQVEYNRKIADDRISFGFYDEKKFEKFGTKIANVRAGSVAEKSGLLADDIIIGMDGMEAKNIEKLLSLRNKHKRGDSFTLTILRDGEELELSGKFPETSYYNAFNYSSPSGAVKAKYFGNHFEINTSRVSQLALYIHPKMINIEIPLIILLNGEEVFNEIVKIDREFMTNNFKRNLDKEALWIKRIIVNLK